MISFPKLKSLKYIFGRRTKEYVSLGDFMQRATDKEKQELLYRVATGANKQQRDMEIRASRMRERESLLVGGQ